MSVPGSENDRVHKPSRSNRHQPIGTRPGVPGSNRDPVYNSVNRHSGIIGTRHGVPGRENDDVYTSQVGKPFPRPIGRQRYRPSVSTNRIDREYYPPVNSPNPIPIGSHLPQQPHNPLLEPVQPLQNFGDNPFFDIQPGMFQPGMVQPEMFQPQSLQDIPRNTGMAAGKTRRRKIKRRKTRR
jgi:hypothetical protein